MPPGPLSFFWDLEAISHIRRNLVLMKIDIMQLYSPQSLIKVFLYMIVLLFFLKVDAQARECSFCSG